MTLPPVIVFIMVAAALVCGGLVGKLISRLATLQFDGKRAWLGCVLVSVLVVAAVVICRLLPIYEATMVSVAIFGGLLAGWSLDVAKGTSDE